MFSCDSLILMQTRLNHIWLQHGEDGSVHFVLPPFTSEEMPGYRVHEGKKKLVLVPIPKNYNFKIRPQHI